MSIFLTIVIFIVLAPLVQGFVISVLWIWFIVPIFHLPAPPIINAIGIALIARIIIAPDYTAAGEKHKNDSLPAIVGLIASKAIVEPFGILAMGWTFKQLM